MTLHDGRDVPSPYELTGRGFLVIQSPRRLTMVEWIRVRLLRRPDPRIDVYPVEAHSPRRSGPDTEAYTVGVRPDSTLL